MKPKSMQSIRKTTTLFVAYKYNEYPNASVSGSITRVMDTFPRRCPPQRMMQQALNDINKQTCGIDFSVTTTNIQTHN